jgi:nitrous oxidase accessory protein NosD
MVYKVSDVQISGGRIIGDRDNHLGTTGQWGHGVQVLGSSRVIVRDIHVSKCWGDGICVGGAMVSNAAPIPSREVVVANVVSTGNRRHGLTIANANGVRVYDSEFSSNRGLEFACGIDIEPSNGNPASNIHIENCTITLNERNGVEMHAGASSIVVQDCTIHSNTGYGVFSVGVQGVYVAKNSIKYNGLAGVAVRAGCVNHQISRNYFYYNSKRFHNSVPTLQSTATLINGYRYAGHTERGTGISDIRITYNYYYDATFLNRFL